MPPLSALALGGTLTALIELMVCGDAFAAVQGTVGANSSGTIEVSLTKVPALQVSGSRDVVLSSADAWSDSQAICIVGQGIAGYRLSVLRGAGPARIDLDGLPVGRGQLIPVRSDRPDCRDSGRSTLSLAGSGGGHSTMVLLVSPE